MKLLVINSGSSSIKYQLFEMKSKSVLCAGVIEKIGESVAGIEHTLFVTDGSDKSRQEERAIADHRKGLEIVNTLLLDAEVGAIYDPSEIVVVGHRVVHGGDSYSSATFVTEEVKRRIKQLIPLAPLHNPPNLQGIEVAEEVFPNAQQVAVFDTAFHQTMPEYAFRYAIPNRFYEEHQLRVYGMHGTSHQYICEQSAAYLGKAISSLTAITIHLGNGCSMSAIKDGKSIDTSMGLSPLPGLIMGTRSGDIDPAVIFYLSERLEMSVKEIDSLLNNESGLKGIAGENDLRSINERYESGDEVARLALEMYCYRIKKYIGAYLAVLGRVEAIIFTAGVGENSALIREKACEDLDHMGIVLSEARNRNGKKGIMELQDEKSNIKILVVATDEELSIAEQAFALLSSQ